MIEVLRYACETCGEVHDRICATNCEKCGKEICPSCWVIKDGQFLCDEC